MKEDVIKALEEIRPMLQNDGGDIELIDVDENTGEVKVKLTGACRGCPMASVTLQQGVEARLKEVVPGVKSVVNAE
ncbi:MAG: NifU family protein [Candidatus Goldiibacteriota bacterium]